MAVYYASKAYVLSFTEALRGELGPQRRPRHRAVPGSGAVGISDPRGLRARLRFGGSQCVARGGGARQAYHGLMANKRAVLPGLGIKIVPFMLRLFPRGFILSAVGRFQTRQALKARNTPEINDLLGIDRTGA